MCSNETIARLVVVDGMDSDVEQGKGDVGV